jgi:hypothetical protein
MERPRDLLENLDDGEEVLPLVLQLRDARGEALTLRVGEGRGDSHGR